MKLATTSFDRFVEQHYQGAYRVAANLVSIHWLPQGSQNVLFITPAT